jgi:hypothetical protein
MLMIDDLPNDFVVLHFHSSAHLSKNLLQEFVLLLQELLKELFVRLVLYRQQVTYS